MSPGPAARIAASALALAALARPAAASENPAAPAERPAGEPCLGLHVSGDLGPCVRALRAAPEALMAKRALARVLIAAGDFEGAIGIYEAIATVYPDDPEAQADLGGSLGFVRRYAEAVEPMEAVIRLRPDDIATHRAIAVIYAVLGRDADAFRATLKAARLGDPISMFDLYQFYRDGAGVGRDREKALAWAERAADHGHLGALRLMVRVHLEGLLGRAADEAEADRWALKFKQAREREGARD